MKTTSALLLLLALGVPAVSGRPPEWPVLSPGLPVRGEIAGDGEHWTTYRFKIGPETMAIRLMLEGSPVDMDLYLRHGSEMENWTEEPDHRADSLAEEEEILVGRWDDPPLRDGIYYLDVSLPGEGRPWYGERRLPAVPYTLRLETIPFPETIPLVPGDAPRTGRIEPEEGYFDAYRIDVPPGAVALRIDVESRANDIDLYLRYGEPFANEEEADHVRMSRRSRETLLLDARSDPPLRSGPYHLQVRSAWFARRAIPYSLSVSFDTAPPGHLLALPEFPAVREGIPHAVDATVQVLNALSSGTGVLIDPRGWILTAEHVVGRTDEERTGLVIAVTTDDTLPPVDMFLARVVESDAERDMALLKIESGLYGQPLPEGYRFPFVPPTCRERLPIGSPLTVIGYPGIGGEGSREPISVSRGILSGFDPVHDDWVQWKSDATISGGNSGGPVLDERFRLVGLAVETLTEDGGYAYYGYIIPMEALPEGWLRHLE